MTFCLTVLFSLVPFSLLLLHLDPWNAVAFWPRWMTILVCLVGIDVCKEMVSELHDLGLVHLLVSLAEVLLQDPRVEL